MNSLDPFFSKTEFLHMISITAPKVVFCDAEIQSLVQECLQELENDAIVFTFGGTADGSTSVEQVFEKIPGENMFTLVSF